MAKTFLVLIALAVCGLASGDRVAVNPIRKVTNLLQNLQKKVQAEAETETALYEKFMCYCKTGVGALEESIASAEAKVSELGSAVKAQSEEKAQLEADLTTAQASRAEAKAAIQKATALRKKESEAFAAESSDLKTNLAALEKATAAISKGAGAAFLQTTTAGVIRKIALDAEMMDANRQDLLAFLSGTQGVGYAPQSGEIVGILKTMSDEMGADLKNAVETERTAIADYEGLVAAKKKEVDALTSQIEEKTQRVGDLAVELATKANDLEDTQESLAEDTKFLAELKTSCESKTGLYEENQRMRGLELVALADTIKVLSDDDALELFKKTLPGASASFVQFEVTGAAVGARALAILRSVKRSGRPQMDLIALALRGKKIGFEKVIGMIDAMTQTLKNEQSEDDEKKDYCAKEFDASDDKKKAQEQSVADSETAIEEAEGAIAELKDEIKALEDGIKALDKSVAEATEQRKEEHSDYSELMANDGAAKELLEFAKNRLNKFYNPKLYKAPPKRELSEEDQLTVSMGGTLAPTAAPGGIAGTGISALAQVAPAPPPESFGAYSKSSEEGGGVIAMIDLLVKDLDKEMQVAKVDEDDAQADYEKLMKESANKRAGDSKSVSDKGGAKAELEEQLQNHKDEKKSTSTELMETMKYIASLHAECDWLVQYYSVRKEARNNEIDALGKAKAVLSGADFSLVQTKRLLGRRMKGCGPQTKLSTSSSADAAGTAQFVDATFVAGDCKLVGSDKITALKFCGPGTLVVSRMTCQSHDYKADTFEHSSADYTTNCETISLAGTVAAGWLGSYSVSC